MATPDDAAFRALAAFAPPDPTITHRTDNPHSVELTLTSAGKVGATVKVYDDDPDKAMERAWDVLRRIRVRTGDLPPDAGK